MPNPDGTQDNNALSLYETSSGARLRYDALPAPSGSTAALKITSHCHDLTVTAETIEGGSENCVDLNNECEFIRVLADRFVANGKYALSAKTCSHVTFTGHIAGKVSQWHVNLGSWSDQSDKVQSDTTLELTADVYPILVWVGNAEIPHLDDPKKYQIIGFGRHGAMVRSLGMLIWALGKVLHLA